MNELALFAGAGGGILGSVLLGHRVVGAVEIDPYCREVLLRRQEEGHLPPFPIWDDVRTFDGAAWRGAVDILSAGFPCQPFSGASRGRRTAVDLWPEVERIVSESKPRYVFAENVSRKAIDAASDGLEEMGYTARAVPLSASDLGADHIRKRYWVLAHTNNKGELRIKNNAEMEKLPFICPRIWETGPDDAGMVDGFSCRVDRIRATGNGQVPSVAAAAWTILRGVEE